MENENLDQNNIKSFQLVIASKNIHKIREIKTILNEITPNIDLLSLIDFPKYIPPEETGESFADNANAKAIHAAKALNRWVISDDSGLVIPALNGEPGVFSARYAGEKATDSENRKKLLSKLVDLSDKDLYAYFECCMAVASPERLKKSVCAKCEGRIETQERGGGGFGYDPLFVKHDYNQTFAQLKEAVKNKISHRRKALDKIAITIESIQVTK
ncbi:MAG: Non-canonical purine NTP pyrophosphatase [Candidatus Anoxychlamydiales bacterium]|nr:Non-canonical purine NTP pyrophosphatase [Candidatus Anoxychlamydiales bacterium]